MVKDVSQGLTDEGRFRLLDETLANLTTALVELNDLITARQPTLPPELGVPVDLAATVKHAIADVAGGVALIKGMKRLNGAISEADGFMLKQLPDRVKPHVSRIINAWSPVRKVFVAVHGIGDQFQSETVQSVAFQVCDYVGVPAALPLGRFHGPGGTVARVFVPEPDRDPPINCGFAEIYWADVPAAGRRQAHPGGTPQVDEVADRAAPPPDPEAPRPRADARYALTFLPGLANPAAIPGAGVSRIVVAEVGDVLHFRIFDVAGKVVVDTDETRLVDRDKELEHLRRRLKDARPPRVPTRREEQRIIAAVIPVVDQARSREDDERLEQLLEELIAGSTSPTASSSSPRRPACSISTSSRAAERLRQRRPGRHRIRGLPTPAPRHLRGRPGEGPPLLRGVRDLHGRPQRGDGRLLPRAAQGAVRASPLGREHPRLHDDRLPAEQARPILARAVRPFDAGTAAPTFRPIAWKNYYDSATRSATTCRRPVTG